MKLTTLLFSLVVCGLSISNVQAFPSMPNYLKDGYKDQQDYKPFLETLEGLKTKCDVCHKPGADKKAKGHGLNDFGKVYHDRFKHKAKKHRRGDETFQRRLGEVSDRKKRRWQSFWRSDQSGKIAREE